MKQNSNENAAARKAAVSRILRLALTAVVIILFLLVYNRLFGGQDTNSPVGEASFTVETSQSGTIAESSSPEESKPPEESSSPQAESSAAQEQSFAESESVPESEPKTQISEPEPESQPESQASEPESEPESELEEPAVLEDDEYYTPEDVALYLHLYGHLPSNYITKEDAQDAGWVSSKGNLWKVTDHKVIGGSRFGNYEGNLPTAKGRKYYECDVNYYGGYRGEERLVYSNDGLIYYTDDHYNTFTLLYDKDGAK